MTTHLESEDEQTFHVTCHCGSPEDLLQLQVDEHDDPYAMMYVYVNKNHYLPWYQRLVVAARYVLGNDTKFCSYGETVLNRPRAIALRDWIDKHAERLGE